MRKAPKSTTPSRTYGGKANVTESKAKTFSGKMKKRK